MIEHSTDEMWIAAGFTYSQAIAEEKGKSKQSKTFEELVPEQYRDFTKVFSEEASQCLPEYNPSRVHEINLKPGAPETHSSKNYPMPVNKSSAYHEFIDEHLAKGTIRPSQSPIASPVFFIKKKDGKLRLVQDYRWLNEWTVKNKYPLPLTADIINRLAYAKFFTKLDVRWGYNHIRIKKGDEWKAAFTSDRGLFEPLVMFFGLCNSPATFQAIMNSIFSDLIAKGKVIVYLDDILIFTKTIEEHREIVREVLKRLQDNDLYLRPEKCEFEREEIEYLGMIIRQNEVKMDPAKVEAIAGWDTPKNFKALQAFTGFANFYRRFIKDFSGIVRPLNDLTKKNTPWKWGPEQQKVFDTLKKMFISQSVLRMWHPDLLTRIETDASAHTVSGIISQKQLDDGLYHPIAYRSESMTEAERNYEIYDRELLAIINALEDWRHYCEGIPNVLEIVSDHQNLVY